MPGNSADIAVVKQATLASLLAGDVETFGIQITNAGTAASSNVAVTDDLTGLINSAVGPTGSGYISETVMANAASGINCTTAASGGTSRQLSCTIANLPVCTVNLNCPVITVWVRPGGNAGARTDIANALSPVTADPNLGNNSGSVPYAITARADVTVTKSGSPATVAAGQDLTYVIAARNEANGLSAADAVTITDTLPANVAFISASPSAGACGTAPAANSTTGPGNNSLICNVGTIANGAQQTLTVVVRPNPATRGTALHNDVAVSTTTTETNPPTTRPSSIRPLRTRLSIFLSTRMT